MIWRYNVRLEDTAWEEYLVEDESAAVAFVKLLHRIHAAFPGARYETAFLGPL